MQREKSLERAWSIGCRETCMRIVRLFLRTALKKGLLSVITIATAIASLYAALGDQRIVRDYTAARGWSLIVPINVDGNALTDSLSYNATTGRAIVSVGIGTSGHVSPLTLSFSIAEQ